jgi:hypothetical protein
MQKLIIIAAIVGFFGFFLALGAGYAYTWYDYETMREQPIAFDHKIHAGQLGVPCSDCHNAAAISRQATMPAVQKCASCHKAIQVRLEELIEFEIEKIEAEKEKIASDFADGKITAAERDNKLVKKDRELARKDRELDPVRRKNLQKIKEHVDKQEPIAWVRVHALPSHVYFSHKPHIKQNIECTTCHGRVEWMGIARQVAPLTMGWCVSCHKSRNAPHDCTTCHQ